ncbi:MULTISPECIES: 6-phosphogluconolactonase [Lysobacter]|uniref:6-phosphogluconolactonase n=1 Tax=Lysobacter TaxID=68 RepID=UPI001F2C7380|nr:MULTISPECIES: 6-phosphogluconolactonase [Lysobacter]UJB18927.1 6-phosphogluconolactonase [Lysobacter capsici]UJQ27348.1 6-phosphogluconolactonase [Lysobacter gummosus]
MKMQAERLKVIEPLPLPLHERLFDDGEQLAQALAKQVAADLRGALARHGEACIALSGGNTPKRFFDALSTQTLDWARVTVLPVDERWLPPEHPRSNERLLREHLCKNNAAVARLLPMYRPTPTPEMALMPVLTKIANEGLPLDVVVLGMGEDGHVASLFPDLGYDNPALREIGLQPRGRAPVMSVRTSAMPEPRMTLTLSAIFTAPAIYLHIEGESKRAVLEGAQRDPRSVLPIRSVLSGAPVAPTLYWSP